MIHEVCQSVNPFAEWETIDGRKHKLYKILETDPFVQAFHQVDAFYILDGHHRFEASSNYLSYVGEKAEEKDKWIQGIIYSAKYVRTFPQHRKILSSEIDVLETLMASGRFEIQEIEEYNSHDESLEIVLL